MRENEPYNQNIFHFQWAGKYSDGCIDLLTEKIHKDQDVFVRDCEDLCECSRDHITCESFCPNIDLDQCPPRTKPIYIDVDISQFGVTCPCKGNISSTAWKTSFNRVTLLETTRSLFVFSRDLKIQRRRRPQKRRLKREFAFFYSSSPLFQLIPLEVNFQEA